MSDVNRDHVTVEILFAGNSGLLQAGSTARGPASDVALQVSAPNIADIPLELFGDNGRFEDHLVVRILDGLDASLAITVPVIVTRNDMTPDDPFAPQPLFVGTLDAGGNRAVSGDLIVSSHLSGMSGVSSGFVAQIINQAPIVLTTPRLDLGRSSQGIYRPSAPDQVFDVDNDWLRLDVINASDLAPLRVEVDDFRPAGESGVEVFVPIGFRGERQLVFRVLDGLDASASFAVRLVADSPGAAGPLPLVTFDNGGQRQRVGELKVSDHFASFDGLDTGHVVSILNRRPELSLGLPDEVLLTPGSPFVIQPVATTQSITTDTSQSLIRDPDGDELALSLRGQAGGAGTRLNFSVASFAPAGETSLTIDTTPPASYLRPVAIRALDGLDASDPLLLTVLLDTSTGITVRTANLSGEVLLSKAAIDRGLDNYALDITNPNDPNEGIELVHAGNDGNGDTNTWMATVQLPQDGEQKTFDVSLNPQERPDVTVTTQVNISITDVPLGDG